MPNPLEDVSPEERQRAATMQLDELPLGETFDWVERVSKKLTMLMHVTLLAFPLEERVRLGRFSEVLIATPG